MLGKHRNKRSAIGRTVGRAVRWIDDWTVEAFNPRTRSVRNAFPSNAARSESYPR